MKQNEKNLKSQKVECRLSEKEKKILLTRAKKLDISISEYIRQCIFSDNSNYKDSVLIVELITLVTDIVRYIEDRNDSEDEWLRKKVAELWKKLS